MRYGTDRRTAHVFFCMSTESPPRAETVKEKPDVVPEGIYVDIAAVFTLVLGAFVFFVGTLILFAASPTLSAEPVFAVSAAEPVTVVANMAVGVSVMASGIAISLPELDRLL